MVAYISSVKYNSIISSVVKEKDEIVAHNLINDHVNLYKYIQANVTLFTGYDYFIVDISAVDDVDDDIIKALEMYRTFNERTRIIIVSPNRRAGSELLAKIFSLGINNIAASFDQVELREELFKCMSESGKSFKEAIMFKDVSNTLNSELKEVKKLVEKVTIGFASCQSRIGCTHNSIIMALSLRKKGYIVAIVEMCKSTTFNKIRNSFNKQLQNNYFSIDGLDFYPDADKHTLVEIKQKAYNFIIIDFGNYTDFENEEYYKCHEKIMIVGSKPWEIEHLSEFLSIYDDETLASIHYIFNFTPNVNHKEIKRNLKLQSGDKLRAYFQDYTPDLFNTFSFKDLDRILNDYLTDKNSKNKKRGIFGMKKFIFSLLLGIAIFSTACGSKSQSTNSSNNDKPTVESHKNKSDKDAPSAELLVSNGFLYNEKREITAYDFIDQSTVKDESDVVAGFINIKEGNFIKASTFVSDYMDKQLEATEEKFDKKKMSEITETISANTTDSYSISADLVLADVNGNAKIYPVVIDIDNEAPVIYAPDLYIEWNVGENIWNFDGYPENHEAKVYNAETKEEIQMTDEDFKNILQEEFANVGLNYSDNFFGNMAFHTVIITKDGNQAFRSHTYDSVKDVSKPLDKDLLNKDPKAAELPELKGLLSSSTKDENGQSVFVYNISYGTKSLAPNIDQSVNDSSLPEDNTLMRHYIQKIKLEDSTNETYVERHIAVKFIGN